jgi:hypothetical protein
MAWTQIVAAVLAVVIIILILAFYIPVVWGEIKTISPVFFEITETIRCRLHKGPCLSLYPNPVKVDEKVTATIRGSYWHDSKTAYVVKVTNMNLPRESCVMKKDRCSKEFTVISTDDGSYTAYIDVNANGKYDEGIDDKDPDQYELVVE